MQKMDCSKLLNFQAFYQFLQQLILSVTLLMGLVLFSPTPTALAAPTAPTAQPPTCSVGVYLLSLQDLNVAERSFGADFWIWTNCSTQVPDALQLMDFVSSKEIETSLDSEQEKGNVYWSTRKVHGVFKHAWNINNFPFDRHVLEIPIEHGLLDTTSLIYQPEAKTSGYQENSDPAGWQITSFQVKGNIHEYKTTYGDPTLNPDEGSRFSRVVVAIGLQRSSFIGFLKLTIAVYISVGIALGIYLISPSSGFEARLGTLVGALFAIVVNQQVTDATLGETEGLKLVDQIHITAMVYVLAAVVLTILASRECEAGHEKVAIRRDRLSFYISVVSFVVANLILIGRAAFTG